jgi:hypothetical protein
MESLMERKEYRPELLNRRSELIAWGTAVLVNGAWLFLIFYSHWISYWLPILGIPLFLIAMGISLGNWMDRKTIMKLDENGIYFSNGLRKVKLDWDAIDEVRVLPAQWGQKVQVFGEEAYFAFHTLGEVTSNGRVLGQVGFKDGDRILEWILAKSNLIKREQLDLGDQKEGYTYSRQ